MRFFSASIIIFALGFTSSAIASNTKYGKVIKSPESVSVLDANGQLIEYKVSSKISSGRYSEEGFSVNPGWSPKCMAPLLGTLAKSVSVTIVNESEETVQLDAPASAPGKTVNVYGMCGEDSNTLEILSIYGEGFKMFEQAQQEDDLILLFSLQDKSDNKVVSKIDIYGKNVDPNNGHSDKYRVEIDGKIVDVPMALLTDLDYNRREYSYDDFTDGVKSFVSGGYCRMGGPAKGSVLMVRYLTYTSTEPNNPKLSSHEMKPVLSENDNCLFAEGYAPVNPQAEIQASKAMSTLKTIKLLLSNSK